MNIAARWHKPVTLAEALDQAQYSPEELSIHSRFAKAAAQRSDLDHTYQQFKAMRLECAQRGLRARAFRHFCKRANAYHNHRSHFLHGNIGRGHPEFWPDNALPADLKALLWSLDHTSAED